jgi:hypothetical protein
MASSSAHPSITAGKTENDDSQQRVPDGPQIAELQDLADHPPFCFILTNDARFIRRNQQVNMSSRKGPFQYVHIGTIASF